MKRKQRLLCLLVATNRLAFSASDFVGFTEH